MVDFFGRQEQSRRVTRWLLVLYAVAVLLIVAAVTVVASAVMVVTANQLAPMAGVASWSAWASQHATTLGVVAAATAAFIGLASLYRTATLAQGGGQVARMMGATEITADSADPLHRRLINVTEEMAIASGIPVPQVFVLEQEEGINAFAAGLSPSDAAIAVTRGALEQLDRAELQGVIAHEFSHVLNGDMRLNVRLMGLTFGILVLSLAGRWLLYSGRFGRFGGVGMGRRGRGGGGGMAAMLMLGLALMVIGAIGVLFSRLIKAAVSRQREMLADASAVQFTRDPTSLAGALKKIGGFGSNLSSVESEEIAHMLFERGGRRFSGLFATHPPLAERIKALDPSFQPGRGGMTPAAAGAPAAGAASALAGTGGGSVPGDGAAPQALPPEAGADSLLAHAGEVGSPAVGGALRAALPETLDHAAHQRESSFLLVLALALAPREATRGRQLAFLEGQLGAQRAERCRTLRGELDQMKPELRLPLLEITLPALKTRPSEQLRYLFDLLGRLSALTDDPRLADYVLLRVLDAYLDDLRGAPLAPSHKVSTSDAVKWLLTNVAAYGHDGSASARAAYEAGVTALGKAAPRGQPPSFEPLEGARDLGKLDAALAHLSDASPAAKRRLLTAVLAVIRHDHKVEVEEIELFRAIAATLGVPVPPVALIPDAAPGAQ